MLTRLGRSLARRLKIHFGVNVPAESGVNLSRTLTNASGSSSVDGLVHGVEGMWRTVTQTPKVAPKMGANGPLVTAVQVSHKLQSPRKSFLLTLTVAQLAYHTVRSPDPSSLRLVYRLSLIFGTHPPNAAHGVDQALLDRIWASPHIAVVARKITIAKSGRKASKPFVLPVVRPTQKDAKGKSGIEVVDGAMMYVMEGFTELNKMEAKNVTTCSVVVR